MDTATWKFETVIDLNLTPGCFVNPNGESEFEPLPGIRVKAFNWFHAEYRAAKQILGEDFKCAHCGSRLSACTVIFVDSEGKYHGVGRDCARFISSKLPRDAYEQLETIASMRDVQTKNGPRKTLSFKSPDWMQFVPREKRPSFISLRPWENKRKQERVWYVTIWGANENEVLENYAAFKALRALAK